MFSQLRFFALVYLTVSPLLFVHGIPIPVSGDRHLVSLQKLEEARQALDMRDPGDWSIIDQLNLHAFDNDRPLSASSATLGNGASSDRIIIAPPASDRQVQEQQHQVQAAAVSTIHSGSGARAQGDTQHHAPPASGSRGINLPDFLTLSPLSAPRSSRCFIPDYNDKQRYRYSPFVEAIKDRNKKLLGYRCRQCKKVFSDHLNRHFEKVEVCGYCNVQALNPTAFNVRSDKYILFLNMSAKHFDECKLKHRSA